MKKYLILLLAAAMLLSTAALAENTADARLGLLQLMGVDGNEWTSTVNTHMKEVHNQDAVTMDNTIYYSTLPELEAALEKGEVKAVSVNKPIAMYITAHTDLYNVIENGGNSRGSFSMMLPAEADETLALINGAIAAMEADGTLAALQDKYIYGGAYEEQVQIPAFEGAQTIRVAITGTLPPVDHANENGEPVGFSSALLAEIAERAQVNIETVLVKDAERSDVLASGAADALFWVRIINCLVEGCDGYNLHEFAGDAVITQSYLSDTLSALVKK